MYYADPVMGTAKQSHATRQWTSLDSHNATKLAALTGTQDTFHTGYTACCALPTHEVCAFAALAIVYYSCALAPKGTLDGWVCLFVSPVTFFGVFRHFRPPQGLIQLQEDSLHE